MLGWPLGDSALQVGAAIMLNILGEAAGEEGMRLAHQTMARAYKVRPKLPTGKFECHASRRSNSEGFPETS